MPRGFVVLLRAFFAQFFASDSVTSDHQLRQAMIGVLAFLVVPGLLIPFQLSGAFEFAAIRFPALLEPLTRLMVTIFITYAMVTIGVIAAFAWDSLSFTRLDAMVLGPLPLRGRTVIAAKLAAMALFLLAAAAAINVMTAVPFAMIASSHKAVASAGRHMVAHMVATMCAATFVFCAFVTLRALFGLVSGGRAAVASLVQFALVSALLCFIVFVPTAVQIVPAARVGRRVVQFAVHQQPIPAWSPTNWFLGLYEVIRGFGHGEFDRAAVQAIVFTLAAVIAAILTTFVGYRRQLQLALTPAASTGTAGTARIQRAIASLLTGRDLMARAISHFILTTIARNRAQQAPIAINAAIGLAIIVAGLSRSVTDTASLFRPRTAVLWIPLVLGYWTIIGLRAAFFVPSDLPASWSFRSNAPDHSRAYWSAVRASMIAFIVPPVLLIDLLLAPILGWRMAAAYALVSSTVVILLAEVVALTIDFIPFTRAYRPGHAKLKTRWPLYLIGLYVFAFWPARLQLWMSGGAASSLQMAAGVGVAIAIAEFAGRRRAARWTVESEEEPEDDLSRIAVLNIGGAAALALVILAGDTAHAQSSAPRNALPSQTVVTATGGDITITPFMHASVQIEHAGRVIQVDPAMGDVTKAKAADLVLVTDEHDDHYNPSRIAKVRKPGAPVVVPPAVQTRADGAIPAPIEVLVNDQRKTIAGFAIEAVAMYNVQRTFGDEPFHTKGRGNGYVITVGGKRLYLAGDTECVPEIKALQNIDVAFLPMNVPFTMPPSEAADCARAFKPTIVIPYHFQGQNTDEFDAALKGSGIEVRELNWYPAVNYPDVVAVPRPGTMVDVGGRKLHMHCTGSGQPTVILMGGEPSFAMDWFFVQPDIAKTNRVCSYDRAGSGWSEPSGHQETVDSAVADLHAALKSAGEKPPYVLVGAGVGALFTRAYQLLYPEDITGLVLVDGAHEDGFLIPVDGQPAPIWSVSAQQLRSAWEMMRPPKDMPPPPMPPPQTDAPFDKLPPDLLTTRVTFESRLFKSMAATDPDQFLDMLERQRAALTRLHEASFKQAPPLGNRPLIVLTAEYSPDREAKALQARLVFLSANSSHRFVAKSGAEIHLYEPSAVIRAIQDVVEAARRGSRLPQR